MAENPLKTVSRALSRSGIGTYRIIDDALLKAGGPNRDRQAWSGIAIRLDQGDAYVVELELTLDRHLAADAVEAERDLRNHFEEASDETYDLSPATIDPVWGHWRCSVSQRCHGIDEAVEQVRDMLEWEF